MCRHGLVVLGHWQLGRQVSSDIKQSRACNCRIPNWAAAGVQGQRKSEQPQDLLEGRARPSLRCRRGLEVFVFRESERLRYGGIEIYA